MVAVGSPRRIVQNGGFADDVGDAIDHLLADYEAHTATLAGVSARSQRWHLGRRAGGSRGWKIDPAPLLPSL